MQLSDIEYTVQVVVLQLTPSSPSASGLAEHEDPKMPFTESHHQSFLVSIVYSDGQTALSSTYPSS